MSFSFPKNISWVYTAAALTDSTGGGRQQRRGSECHAKITAYKSIKMHFISGERT